MKNFIITDANFNNKGAQAMLFITVSELRKHFPECEIDVDTNDNVGEAYRFNPIKIRHQDWIVASGGLNSNAYKKN